MRIVLPDNPPPYILVRKNSKQSSWRSILPEQAEMIDREEIKPSKAPNTKDLNDYIRRRDQTRKIKTNFPLSLQQQFQEEGLATRSDSSPNSKLSSVVLPL